MSEKKKQTRMQYNTNIRFESFTVSLDSADNIQEMLEKGGLLVIGDCNIQLLELVMPIIEWKYQRMMKLLFYYIQREKTY